MLKSYSYMPPEMDISFYYEVWEEITRLKWYFYKFAGINADEAIHRTLIHTLTHFQPEKGNLSSYIKKLAREIAKDNSRLVVVDFLEQTLASDDEELVSKPTVDAGNVQDFSQEVINDIEFNKNRRSEVVELALEFMDRFIILCEALEKHDTSTRYYPEIFIKQCLSIDAKCGNFNQLCLDLYKEFGDEFKWFTSLADIRSPEWREADYLLINSHKSKRFKLCNVATGLEVEDADLEDFKFVGTLGRNNRILKVRYYELWEMMCDLIDSSETNEMKFIIDDSYIIRTFGGSFSVINVDLYNEYDVVRMEILTNILQDTNGRILNVGSEHVYLVYSTDFKMQKNIREVYGHVIEFDYVDITDSI